MFMCLAVAMEHAQHMDGGLYRANAENVPMKACFVPLKECGAEIFDRQRQLGYGLLKIHSVISRHTLGHTVCTSKWY